VCQRGGTRGGWRVEIEGDHDSALGFADFDDALVGDAGEALVGDGVDVVPGWPK
jgi:hypothetical protein